METRGADDRAEARTVSGHLLRIAVHLRITSAGDLEAAIADFVGHYNHRRYHESLKNITPADVYFGRGQTSLLEREKIKRRTFEKRRLQHARTAA